MMRVSRPFALIAPAAALIGIFLIVPYFNIIIVSLRAPAQSTPYGGGF
jgi:putative spermidine/putrescine transport system permease protein